jgi:hypothetical protein
MSRRGTYVRSSIKPTPRLLLCALVVLGVGLVTTPGSAQPTTAGTVVAWGCNGSGGGQCAVPVSLAGTVTAIAAGDTTSLALKSDGTVVSWCGYDYGQCTVPSGLSGVTALASAWFHNLALKTDGTVVAWGCATANAGQCNVPSGLSGVTSIAAGDYHSVAAKSDGSVVAWGCGPFNYGQCSVPGGLSGVTSVAAGSYHSLALRTNGTVAAWGCLANYGQCNVPVGLSGVTAIAAADFHSLALKSDGTVVAWGCGANQNHGQCDVPSDLSGVTAIAAGDSHSLALKSDGTVVAWGCSGADHGQCAVPSGMTGVTAIAASYAHSLALAHLADQTIDFPPLPNRTDGDPDFTVSAAASSGLPVSFRASGPCLVNGATVQLHGVGTCTITASQGGNAHYNPAPDVPRSFTIVQRPQPPAPPPPPPPPPPAQIRCVVPRVIGLRLGSARARIRARHCTVGRVRRARSRRVGRVIAQSPRPGTRLGRGARVNLVIGRR